MKRSSDYLKLYLVPARTPLDKKLNRETLQLAEALKGKRLVEMQSQSYGFKRASRNNDKDFLEYFWQLAQAHFISK